MSKLLPALTTATLKRKAAEYCRQISGAEIPKLYGVTDGKAVGTYVELDFRAQLQKTHRFELGNAAKGIDFPSLGVDVKVTSSRQPQSSCPFRSARQKVYGLGYSLLVFVYDKQDDAKRRTSRLSMRTLVFVDAESTGDYQTTSGLIRLLKNKANRDDLIGFFAERMLPLDEIEAEKLADEILCKPPGQGYLTISNALQWRLQYSRAIEQAGQVKGLLRLA